MCLQTTCDAFVLCDKCDRGFHLECCEPALQKRPKSNTYLCHVCKWSDAAMKKKNASTSAAATATTVDLAIGSVIAQAHDEANDEGDEVPKKKSGKKVTKKKKEEEIEEKKSEVNDVERVEKKEDKKTKKTDGIKFLAY